MKNIYKPMLFSTPMVEAILEDRKTKTRRTKGLEEINENPDLWKHDDIIIFISDKPVNPSFIHVETFLSIESGKKNLITSPWQVGDILWVRETFAPACKQFLYKANERFGKYPNQKWKPSLFMPKEACRIFLKITEIRVERLQDISEQDAINEGIERLKTDGLLSFRSYAVKYDACVFPIVSFKTLWQKINGSDSWNKNPWVWVIEFEKIEKPNDFIL